MKLLRRNTTEFEYLPWTGEETDLNDRGEHTGQFYPVYGDPVRLRGNISAPAGKVNQTYFGQDIRYTHTLVMDNPDTEVSESGIIRWNGREYLIAAVRPTLNFLSAALQEQSGNRVTDG